ncbi:hypothetical protein [Massilia sp. S19_KUP03_FR1]|uniref:hypothetical protein n=1 Tax=Massilia sp. S19_KUP03_FR1 TaxID=3025503 RepID=UPI002FCD7B14
MESASLGASVLDLLEPEDLTLFKSTVQFRREEVYDGDDKPVTTRLGVATFSVEVLVKKYKFTPDQIQEVAALFGIGPERFWARYHYFGDTYPEPHCESRPYYNCPW